MTTSLDDSEPSFPLETRLELTVGEKVFQVTWGTLIPCRYFANIYKERETKKIPLNAPVFLDRDPDVFSYVIAYLRLGSFELLKLKATPSMESLVRNELEFLACDPKVKLGAVDNIVKGDWLVLDDLTQRLPYAAQVTSVSDFNGTILVQYYGFETFERIDISSYRIIRRVTETDQCWLTTRPPERFTYEMHKAQIRYIPPLPRDPFAKYPKQVLDTISDLTKTLMMEVANPPEEDPIPTRG